MQWEGSGRAWYEEGISERGVWEDADVQTAVKFHRCPRLGHVVRVGDDSP